MNGIRARLAAALAAGLVAACAAGGADYAQPSSGASATPAVFSDVDQRFVVEALASGMYQVEVARLAEQRALHPQVKAFAAMLVKHNTQMVDELKVLAGSHGFILPQGPPTQSRTLVGALAGLTGDAFDRDYLRLAGVADHQATIQLFEAAHRSAIDEELRTWAVKTLPMLRQHLVVAQQLAVTALSRVATG